MASALTAEAINLAMMLARHARVTLLLALLGSAVLLAGAGAANGGKGVSSGCVASPTRVCADPPALPDRPAEMRRLEADGWVLTAEGLALKNGQPDVTPDCSATDAAGGVGAIWLVAYKGEPVGGARFAATCWGNPSLPGSASSTPALAKRASSP